MSDSLALQSRQSRLLLIIGSLQAGGAERQLSEMANYWSARGARVTFATWNGPEVEDFYILDRSVERVHLGVHGSRVRLLSLIRIFAGMVRLRRLIRASRPDAVLSFIDVSNVCSILAAAGLGVRVVVAERTHPALRRAMGARWRLLRRLCYRHADLVVAQTRDAARWLERTCHARVRVIPNALRPLPLLDCEREPLIIAVGRLSAEKGFDLLLRAFARLERRFPQWRVCIVGEGAERDALLRLREDLHLTRRVELLGEVREVDQWLARAGLLVHPSRREGFPNVVLEAMGMGLAVISADCRAGPAELIEDGVNGRLVPVDDLDALVLVMMELMGSAASREALGREARKVRQGFGQERIMEGWRGCVLPGSSWPSDETRVKGVRAVYTRQVIDRCARVYRGRGWHTIRCAVVRLCLGLLRLLFRFAPWHASAAYACRPYKRAVVELANALHPAVAVEVGCGLGDIISRVRAVERIGIDLDARVIRAARFLHHRVRWIQGDSSAVLQLQQPRIDCLIMVNWIHSLSPDDLAALLLPLLPMCRHLILDAIDVDGPRSYRHKHDFSFLAAVTRRVQTARVPDEQRSFEVFEVLQ